MAMYPNGLIWTISIRCCRHRTNTDIYKEHFASGTEAGVLFCFQTEPDVIIYPRQRHVKDIPVDNFFLCPL